PHPQGAERIGPAHEFEHLRIVWFRRQRVQPALDHATGGAIERDPISFFEHLALHAHLALLLVDFDVTGSGNAALSHATSYNSGVTSHASARGENAFRDFHP